MRFQRQLRRIAYTVAVLMLAQIALADDTAAEVQRLLDALEQLKDTPGAIDSVKSALQNSATPVPDPQNTPEAIEFFETKIRPVLAEHCFECHGPDRQKADLRLDSREAALKGGDTGPAIVAGDSSASLMLKVLAHDGEVKMPPKAKLPDEAIEAIRHWISIGAPWPASATPIATTMEERVAESKRSHWAFQPVSEPAIPAVSKPEWVLTPVDAFVLAQLDANGVVPSEPADRYTFIRRVTFDLTGLPPTTEEVNAFLADESPSAYETLIDRLLASPRYGERWGRYWLDVARYADTRGYVFQSERNIPYSHTYRDYVIRSFNEDLPFNTFVKQQLAADQLDLGDDKRPLAAMGFLTLNRHFLGNIHDITDDRIDVVTRGVMGLTVTCARCHDHKFDPISAEDYYALYGVFRSSVEPGELPLIRDPDPEDPKYQDYLAKLKAAEDELQLFTKDLHVKLLTHARDEIEAYLLAAFDTKDITDEEQFKTVSRDRELRWQLVGRWRDYLKNKTEAHDPVFAPWLAFAALPADAFAEQAATLAAQTEANQDAERPVNKRIAAAFKGDPPKNMAEVAQRYAKVLKEVNAEWLNLLASEAQRGQTTPSTALRDADAEQVRLALYGSDAAANVPEGELLPMYDVPTQNQVRERQNAILSVKSSHPGRPDRAMALVDDATPFEPYVFKRGNPGNKGDSVPRQYLAVLSEGEPKPFEKGSGRLELAEAITSDLNPLTPRVWANRVWMNHFDRGIVDTPSDFGVRTEKPAHAALLDFLAARLVKEGWSTKKLHRLILLSNTYRQQSADNVESRAKDPENRLFWRQNRRRLDFEGLRDAVLASAGTLDLTMGGPSVDIIEPPYTTRRTVYSFIERQNLPGMFRTFDFASPDTHSPRRFRTTVPQQALFMMNSPFVIEQARQLAARPEVNAATSAKDRARSLYTLIYQRAPGEDELAMAERFIANQTTLPSRQTPAWQYGYGTVDEASGRVPEFKPFPVFADRHWRMAEEFPDTEYQYLSLRSDGGHPGVDVSQSPVRRWIAPRDGVISLEGSLHQGEADGQGDGVTGYIVSDRGGVIWKAAVHNTKAESMLHDVAVKAGEIIDFVVSPNASDGYDSFRWSPTVRYESEAANTQQQVEWQADSDFSGPPPPALEPWERYAQVLLASNEFAFID